MLYGDKCQRYVRGLYETDFNCASEGDHYLDLRVGLIFPCSSILPEDGIPIPNM